MHNKHRALVLPLILFVTCQGWGNMLMAAGRLADTGVSDCDRGGGAMELCNSGNTGDSAPLPRQDGRYGYDAANVERLFKKTGAGTAGFDYSKIDSSGTTLPATATLGSGANEWACTHDNITGLRWEMKTSTGLRAASHTYSWYNSNGAVNGGNAGTADGGDNCHDPSRCDLEKYIVDINATSLCGRANWRAPTVHELLSIMHAGTLGLKADSSYFPNLRAARYWTATTVANTPTNAWQVDFGHKTSASANGNQPHDTKSATTHIILVSDGP